MKRNLIGLGAVLLVAWASQPANAGILITEWMYSGSDGEYVEFTNTGPLSIDMTGWSFDDDSAIAGTVDLSSYGTVAVGESVLLIEPADASAFRTDWGQAGSV